MKLRYAWLLTAVLFAAINLFAQSSATQTQGATAAQKPFPLADLKNWKQVPGSESDIAVTQTFSIPLQFGDIIVEGKPQCTATLLMGRSEELVDPVSGDKVRRHIFINTGEYVLFAWESPAGSAPKYILLREDGTLATGDSFSIVSGSIDERWLLTSVKVVLETQNGAEIASRTVRRKPDTAQTGGQK